MTDTNKVVLHGWEAIPKEGGGHVLRPITQTINADTNKVEPVHWIVPDFGFLFPAKEAAERYLRNIECDAEPTPLVPASALTQEQAKVRELVEVMTTFHTKYRKTLSPDTLDAAFAAAIAKYGEQK